MSIPVVRLISTIEEVRHFVISFFIVLIKSVVKDYGTA